MVRHTKIVVYTRTCLVNTGAGPNLVNNVYLRPQWKTKILQLPTSKLQTATKHAIYIARVISLIVQIRDLQVSAWFSRGDNLALDVVLGRMFIDRWFPGIFPLGRKTVPLHSWSFAIVSSRNCPEAMANILLDFFAKRCKIQN